MIINNMKRIAQLDSLRFFAIFVITLSHMDLFFQNAGNFGNQHIYNFVWGVDYFFILSGFGLFLNSVDKEIFIKPKDLIKYAIDRVKFMYPLYIVTLFLCIPYSIYYDLEDNSFFTSIILSVVKLIICSTLLQTGTGIGSTHYALNSPTWFLSSLFISCMIAPLFICLVRKCKNAKAAFVGIVLSYAGIQIVSMFMIFVQNNVSIGPIHFNALLYSSPYVRCLYILLGMYIASFTMKITREIEHQSLWEILIILVCLIWFFYRNAIMIDDSYKRLIDVFVAAAPVLIFPLGEGCVSCLLNTNLLVQLGKDSIYVFLLQWPIIKLEQLFVLLPLQNRFGISGLTTGFLQIFLFVVTIIPCISLVKKSPIAIRKK